MTGIVEKYRGICALTTAEIVYHLPDAEHRLQTFIWQDYDQAPDFPALRKFLDFWQRNLDGKVHSVRVDHVSLTEPWGVRLPEGGFAIH